MRRLLAAAVRIAAWPLTSVSPPSAAPADAVVVLGAPLQASGALTPQAEERVQAGVAIYRAGLAPVICLVGGHGPAAIAGTAAEAEGMARRVRALGVPEGAVRVDRLSTTTHTNALRAAELLLPEGRRRVWVVTQPFHTRRALYHFRRAGFEPRAWRISPSVQELLPAKGLAWIAREYAAWALALARAARDAARPFLWAPR